MTPQEEDRKSVSSEGDKEGDDMYGDLGGGDGEGEGDDMYRDLGGEEEEEEEEEKGGNTVDKADASMAATLAETDGRHRATLLTFVHKY